MQSLASEAWIADWIWGLPLIVLASLIHVLGLGAIELSVGQGLKRTRGGHSGLTTFAIVVGTTVLFATALHAVGAAVWAGAYLWLGALPDERSAMLYSIGAMTTFGHANLRLADQWQMLGALEALNGMLLFGLTTAFLYATIRNVHAAMMGTRAAAAEDSEATRGVPPTVFPGQYQALRDVASASTSSCPVPAIAEVRPVPPTSHATTPCSHSKPQPQVG